MKFCDVAAQDTAYPHSLLNHVVVQLFTTVGESRLPRFIGNHIYSVEVACYGSITVSSAI